MIIVIIWSLVWFIYSLHGDFCIKFEMCVICDHVHFLIHRMYVQIDAPPHMDYITQHMLLKLYALSMDYIDTYFFNSVYKYIHIVRKSVWRNGQVVVLSLCVFTESLSQDSDSNKQTQAPHYTGKTCWFSGSRRLQQMASVLCIVKPHHHFSRVLDATGAAGKSSYHTMA